MYKKVCLRALQNVICIWPWPTSTKLYIVNMSISNTIKDRLCFINFWTIRILPEIATCENEQIIVRSFFVTKSTCYMNTRIEFRHRCDVLLVNLFLFYKCLVTFKSHRCYEAQNFTLLVSTSIGSALTTLSIVWQTTSIDRQVIQLKLLTSKYICTCIITQGIQSRCSN